MDERLFYIQQNISGIWDNADYSFTLNFSNSDEPNLASFTDKKQFPKTGSTGKFFIVPEEYYYVLRIIFLKDGSPVNSMDFKIDDLDGANNKMQLSHNGVVINLTNVSG